MADFAQWAVAAAPACGWTADEFLAAYKDAREGAYAVTLEASPMGDALERLVMQGPWEGTASELLQRLEEMERHQAASNPRWPKAPNSLSNALRRLQPTLRQVGVQVDFLPRQDKGGTRQIKIQRIIISPFDLERLRRLRKQAGRSDVTINRDLAFLRHVYSMAMTWGRATANPVKQVRFARENTGRLRMLSREEETRLTAHCGPQLTPLVLAALHTGFRASELKSLTWQDVDFRRRLMTVPAAYAKNGESRSVPMNRQLLCVM